MPAILRSGIAATVDIEITDKKGGNVTEQQEQRIRTLAAEMRKRASANGPHHPFWEFVFNMEAFVGGRPTEKKLAAPQWIFYAERSLNLQPGQLPR